MKLFRKYKTYDEILPAFLYEKGIELKDRTYLNYVSKTKLFTSWLKNRSMSELPLRKITNNHISEFFIYLAKERDLDRPTCEKYFLVLRTLWRYAKKRGEVDILPFDLVTFPAKKEDNSAEVIIPEHLRLILPEMKEKDKQLYLAAMMEYYCFIRPGTELRLMKVKDIDLVNGTIQVSTGHAKNGHKRIVTMPVQLIEICKEYGIDKADKELFIFGKHKRIEDRPLSVNMLAYRFNKIRNRLNLTKRYKFYSFKHTGATALHNSNIVSLRQLMDQLGHSRLSATEHYIKRHAGFVNTAIREYFPSPI